MSNMKNEAYFMAKLAVANPAAAVSALRVETPEVREITISKLRVYPAALISLLRADNLPRNWKPIIEDELAMAGFTMMT